MKKHKHECGSCGTREGPLYLHPRCHPGAGTWVRFDLPNLVTVECRECKKKVCSLVAETDGDMPRLVPSTEVDGRFQEVDSSDYLSGRS